MLICASVTSFPGSLESSHPLSPAVVCTYASALSTPSPRTLSDLNLARLLPFADAPMTMSLAPDLELSPSPVVERLEPCVGPRTVLAFLDANSALARCYADWLRSGQADVPIDSCASNVRVASASARGAGKGLFATRSFEPGDLILVERALVRRWCLILRLHAVSSSRRLGHAVSSTQPPWLTRVAHQQQPSADRRLTHGGSRSPRAALRRACTPNDAG